MNNNVGEDSDRSGMTLVFAVQKTHKLVGLVTTSFFVLLACLTAAAPLLNRWMGIEAGDVRAFYFAVPIWLFFILLGSYYIAACFRYRITWTDQTIEIRELFRTRRFNTGEICEMIWLVHSASVRLKGPFGKVKVEFPLFLPSEEARLQRLLHNSVPLEKRKRI